MIEDTGKIKSLVQVNLNLKWLSGRKGKIVKSVYIVRETFEELQVAARSESREPGNLLISLLSNDAQQRGFCPQVDDEYNAMLKSFHEYARENKANKPSFTGYANHLLWHHLQEFRKKKKKC